MIIRVNPIDSPYFMEDIKSVVAMGIDVINLPKS
jgi:citrate lyase beta subunit